ncbi:MAG: Trimethylamine methyltransferase [Thermoanaerobacterales bacterium 50_218]|nr:MAG: Trimethylamine methyltransferase [Thermoanaerobacterales bacterium 50_218]
MGGSYKPLSQKQIEQIHEATLEILENVGVEISNQEAQDILATAGARIDRETNRVYLPRKLVEQSIESAPSEVLLAGRDEKNDLLLSGKRVYLGTGGTALNVLDLENEYRPATLRDCKDIARLVDALDNIHFFVLPVYPNELPKEEVDVNRFYAAIQNTTKHVMGGVYTIEGVRKVIRIAEIIAGGPSELRKRPFISMITSIMSPLKFDVAYTELMLEVARQGIPIATSTCPMAGATAPVTLAGTLVQQNAESLAGIVLVQQVNPGTPVLYSAVPTTVDIRTMDFLFGCVEMGLMNAAISQMAQYYNLPIYSTAGVSDSKLPDAQSGYEKATTALLCALAGSNYVHNCAGLIDKGMTVSYAQYVIDDDINGMVMRAVRGIEVNSDTLAVDVIKQVGPGGNYLAEKHTLKFMRSEFFFPNVTERRSYRQWKEDGAKDCWKRATERAKEILASHESVPIPEEIERRLAEEFPELRV